jgi:pimeloyl-ACP methyl ester carboxylesterase
MGHSAASFCAARLAGVTRPSEAGCVICAGLECGCEAPGWRVVWVVVMSDSGGLRWPRVRYADADGVSIAYEVLGGGGIDVVVVNGLMGGLVASVLDPKVRAHDEWLAAFSRLIRFDRRGQGLSDPVLSGPVSPLEQQVVDIVAVMNAAGSRRAALWAGGDGCQVAMLCAAMHPDRVSALVLNGGWARAYRTDDYPFGADPGDRNVFAQQVHDRWGDLDNPWGLRAFGANRVHEAGFRELFAQVQQASASKAAATPPRS